jgi:Flp pilus assembly protein TadG
MTIAARVLYRFGRQKRGAVMVEFALIFFFLMALTGGVIEFSLIFYQLNAASKSLQIGIRLASVSDPVAENLRELSSAANTGLPTADPVPDFNVVCSGATAQCVDCQNVVCTFSTAAMNTIVYGRGDTNTGSAGCGNATGISAAGMCDIFRAIRPQNVIVTYKQTGLGFVGRPGGPVPTITIQLTGISFGFSILQGLIGLNSIALPSLRVTATGEDMSSQGD